MTYRPILLKPLFMYLLILKVAVVNYMIELLVQRTCPTPVLESCRVVIVEWKLFVVNESNLLILPILVAV